MPPRQEPVCLHRLFHPPRGLAPAGPSAGHKKRPHGGMQPVSSVTDCSQGTTGGRARLVHALMGRTRRGRKDVARAQKCLFRGLQTPVVAGTSGDAAATAVIPEMLPPGEVSHCCPISEVCEVSDFKTLKIIVKNLKTRWLKQKRLAGHTKPSMRDV